MDNTKTVYYVESLEFGEQDFFFGTDGKYIHSWDANDANFRPEYMGPLFKALGIRIVQKQCTGKYRKLVRDFLKKQFSLKDSDFD